MYMHQLTGHHCTPVHVQVLVPRCKRRQDVPAAGQMPRASDQLHCGSTCTCTEGPSGRGTKRTKGGKPRGDKCAGALHGWCQPVRDHRSGVRVCFTRTPSWCLLGCLQSSLALPPAPPPQPSLLPCCPAALLHDCRERAHGTMKTTSVLPSVSCRQALHM